MNFLKQFAGQTIIYGLGTILPRVLNYLLLTPFYTYIFIEAEYGVITELYAYVAFLLVLLTYGMETGFFRFNESEENRKTVYSTSLITLFITSLLFIVFVSIFNQEIATLIKYKSNPEYVIWFALIIGSDAFTAIPFAKLRAENRAVKFSVIKMLNILVNIGFNIFFFVLCPDLADKYQIIDSIYNPEIGVGYAFISNMIASVFTLILLLPEIIKIKLNYDFKLIKRMIKYTFPLLIVGIAGMVNEVADKVLIKYLTAASLEPMKLVGIYGANYKLAVLMTLFIQMFRYASEPFFFAKANEKDSRNMYALILNYFIIFGLTIFLVVMLYIDLVKFFIDKKFHEGLVVVPIVLFANLFLGIYYNLSVWYKLTNKTRFGAYIALMGAALTLVLNYLLIPKIGYLGSAWATFTCYFAMMVTSYFLGQKYYKINYDIKKIFVYIIITIVIFTLSKFNLKYKFLNIYLVNTVLLFSYFTIVFIKEKLYTKISYK